MSTADLPAPASLAEGESSPPPGDRTFRPDIQGLRALAVALVVLYHTGIPGLSGGYIGVDVFFVVSGYVITALLLREYARAGKTNLLTFYARRARRILPASTLVLIVTLIASFHYLGWLAGDEIASDAHAAALFVANFHFIAIGTNYATAQSPPSPLQHFWSLAVEEQFYFVYPTLFLIATATARRISLTTKLAVGLVAITGASYAWSIAQTMNNGTAAYFSPFTRAWELSLGALVAVAAPESLRLSPRLAAGLTWLGIAAVVIAAVKFDQSTPFPGSLAMLPVAGTALVIFGGTQAPRMGAEAGLRLAPLQWLGAISYALYLFHWPILTIYAERGTKTPSVAVNLVLVGIAVVLATVSYRLIENPIRRSRTLNGRRALSLAIVPICIAASLLCIFALRKANHLSLGRTGQEIHHVSQTRTPIPARRAYQTA